MAKKYTEEELASAILLILDEGISPKEVSERTGISLRALQRHKAKLIQGREALKAPVLPAVVEKQSTVPDEAVQLQVDKTMIERAKFLDDVFATKKVLLDRLYKVAKRSSNIDALQKAIKTLNEIEAMAAPAGENPAIHAKTVNMFQYFNQQLIQDGYKGPELTDADIAKGY